MMSSDVRMTRTLSRATLADVLACLAGPVLIAVAYVAGAVML